MAAHLGFGMGSRRAPCLARQKEKVDENWSVLRKELSSAFDSVP